MRNIEKDEWFQKLRDKYLRGNRLRKSQLLDEVTDLLGIHRKAAIRLLKKKTVGRKSVNKRGPKSQYSDPLFLMSLRLVWKETDFMCSKLLKSAMTEWLPSVEKHYGEFTEEVKSKLDRISYSTIDRILKPYKFKSKCGTKPGSLLRNEIPIQGNIWDISSPGFMEADTVAHCGNSLAGQFIWTLTMTDIHTQWTECRAVFHKGAKGVVEQVKNIESHLPFELKGFDCDNGSEFLNNYLVAYFSEKKSKQIDFTFTRSRPYRKNDNAHVEQRNWTHPRALYGRDRLEHYQLVQLMNDLYTNEFSLFRNHFYPTLKITQKVLIKSRYKRIYDTPKTPYQRVMESADVSDDVKEQLALLHNALDPITLRNKIQQKLKLIYRLNASLNSQLRHAVA